MKIAVTSQNRKAVTGHAGKCRKFWVYEIEGGQVKDKALLELAKEQSFHESHGGHHPLDSVNVLISGGMGGGLRSRLAQSGIEALVTIETDPDRAVAAYLQGTLPAGPAQTHGGHGHHHGHRRHGQAQRPVWRIPLSPPKADKA